MSQPKPADLNQMYRAFQTAHTTEGNVIETLMNTVAERDKTIMEQTQDIISFRARVVELEKPPKIEEIGKDPKKQIPSDIV